MTIPIRVLIVEDMEDDMRLLLRELRRGGYEPVYTRVETAETMRAALADEQWDAVVSDYSMPAFDALRALAVLHESGLDVPFIIASGTIGEEDAVSALRAGAHDFVLKGRYARLLPALQRELREAEVRRERHRAEMAEREQRALADTLRDIAASLNRSLDLETVLKSILDGVGRVVPYDSANIMVIESGYARVVRHVGRGGFRVDGPSRLRLSDVPGLEAMAATGRSSIVTDTQADPTWISFADGEWIRSYAGMPIRADGQVLGFLNLNTATPGFYTPAHAERLQALADQAATAIGNARLFAESTRRLERMQAMRAIDQAIISSLDLQTTLKLLLEQVTTRLGVHAADVLLLRPGSNALECAARRGFHTGALQRTHLRLGEGYAGTAAAERRVIHVANLPEAPGEFGRAQQLAGEMFITYLAVPLIAKGQVTGVLEIFHRLPLEPDAEWLEFLEAMAAQAAIAIENAALFADLQRSNSELHQAYQATLEGWSRALDLRDRETEGHTLRVTEMTMRLARALNLPEDELIDIQRGALLHDIGKMGVPDSILLKPGPLTDEEWIIMRHHPQYALDMLSPIAYLGGALAIPYAHHEKWDGTGYPRRLKGEAIPLAARLFAVADVWDALRSDRPYRAGWPEERVQAHIAAEAGKHFEPKVVAAFLKVLNGAKST